MHRVHGGRWVINDYANRVVGAGVVDVPFGVGGVRVVSGFGEEEDGGVIVAAVG